MRHHLGTDFEEPSPVAKHAHDTTQIVVEKSAHGMEKREPWTLSRVRSLMTEAREVCGAIVDIGVALCSAPRVIGHEAVAHTFEMGDTSFDDAPEFASAA